MGKGLLTTIGLGCALLVAGAQMPDAAEKDGPRPENVRDADKLAGGSGQVHPRQHRLARSVGEFEPAGPKDVRRLAHTVTSRNRRRSR